MLIIIILGAFFLLLPLGAYGQLDYPSANLSSQWVNRNSSFKQTVSYQDGSLVRPILLRSPSSGTRYAFGFYCTGASSFSPCGSRAYLLAIFIVQTNSGGLVVKPDVGFPRAVWYANRDRLVGENATLALTSLGDLSLSDADGTLVWSTNTSGKGVRTLLLQPTGNLVLADAQNGSVWQSFDHPVDVIVLGQTLRSGFRLTASTYSNNSMPGPYYMQMGQTFLSLHVDDPVTPQPYWLLEAYPVPTKTLDVPYAQYRNGSLDLFISNGTRPDNSVPIPSTPAGSLSYLQLGADGKARVYSWSSDSWIMLLNLQAGSEKSCSIPTICGPYGVCTDGKCSCPLASSANGSQPGDDAFSPIDSAIPSLGCTSQSPLVCNNSTATEHHFLRLDNYYYPNVMLLPFRLNGSMSIEECQQRCLQNCSYMAAFFLFNGEIETLGICFPISKLYSITTNAQESIHSKSVALIRMQSIVTSAPPNAPFIPPPSIMPPPQLLTPEASPTSRSVNLSTTLSAVLSSATVVGLLILGLFFFCRRRHNITEPTEDEEDMFKAVPGLLPTRFSFRELEVATKNFSEKLGAGGFGSVFLGALPDGSEVAVKCLESASQGWKEFRMEVCIIGSIHHVNLVRLRGFCAEKEHRMLVYEYMPRGSLEKWLYRITNKQGAASDNGDASNDSVLDWDLRFSIALGTARGLAYLHEECSERILHLDVKPANILLDDHFVAKVSDFGMLKLMNRDQSQVVTTMRGTPGYLAPEWLHAGVTEKVDVYSFGILLFEMVSDRKSLDVSVEDSEVMHISVWASRMVEEGRLMDVIDARLLQDFKREQAERMVKVAFWCIHENPARRPSMGTVVQMLEGNVACPDPPLNVSHLLKSTDYYIHTIFNSYDSHTSCSALESRPLAASILSSPR